jgi:hypothetical protein
VVLIAGLARYMQESFCPKDADVELRSLAMARIEGLLDPFVLPARRWVNWRGLWFYEDVCKSMVKAYVADMITLFVKVVDCENCHSVVASE